MRNIVDNSRSAVGKIRYRISANDSKKIIFNYSAKLPNKIQPSCRMKYGQIAERNSAKLPNEIKKRSEVANEIVEKMCIFAKKFLVMHGWFIG